MTKKEKQEIEKGIHSIPMTIIFKLKKQLNFLLVLDLILMIMLVLSFYDSIRVRDEYWKDHTQDVIETIHQHCESERGMAWQD